MLNLLNLCFRSVPNAPGQTPNAKQVTEAPTEVTNFENRAFAALFNNMAELGIASLWRCHAARIDGYLIKVGKDGEDGEIVMLEMKETLGWGQTHSATFQFLAGKCLLKLSAKRGIVVFEKYQPRWKGTLYGAWGQLALHAQEVNEYVEIGALQVSGDGSLSVAPDLIPI